jgi:hypothetical protein
MVIVSNIIQNQYKLAVSSIRLHERTGTLTTFFLEFFFDANALKAAAEEKRRGRAATNFMVDEFDMSFDFFNEGIVRSAAWSVLKWNGICSSSWRGRCLITTSIISIISTRHFIGVA